MNRLDFDGALGAVNAFAVSDDGRRAYLFDPRVDAVIRINIANNSRDTLKWFDKGFHHPRWLCYCMFTMHRDGATYLPTLFYNKKRKTFLLVTFVVDEQKLVLYKTQENIVEVDPVRYERLAYSAHKDESKLHMIFYDRFERHSRPESVDEPSGGLPVVYCFFNCHALKLTTLKKTLPAGQWELPFIAHQALHFISLESSTTQLASIPTEGSMENNNWNIRPVGADLNDALPPRKDYPLGELSSTETITEVACWINAWRAGMGWYLVCEKQIEDYETTRYITLWQLDVLDCQWRKLPVKLPSPVTAKNFALRVDLRNIAFLHCDWERDAAVFQMRLNDLMLQREDEAVAAAEKITQEDDFLTYDDKDESNCAEVSNSEIICPICLETYDDPRTLSCGHSICHNCIEQMKVAAGSNTIRCFACRKATTIPTTGLPINFGLRDAIEALEKVRQLSFSSLRCANCRKLCEESDLWVCNECALEDAKSTTEEVADSVTDGHKKFLFCAQCVLKYHANHKPDELSRFRERHKIALEGSKLCRTKIDGLLVHFREAMTQKLESSLMEPLKSEGALKVKQAFNEAAYNQNSTAKDPQELADDFQERLSSIISNIEVQFEILLKSNGRRLSRYEGPTKL